MKFTTHVIIVDPPEVQEKDTETAKAKRLLLYAFQILAKKDDDILDEAEAFLKGKGVGVE